MASGLTSAFIGVYLRFVGLSDSPQRHRVRRAAFGRSPTLENHEEPEGHEEVDRQVWLRSSLLSFAHFVSFVVKREWAVDGGLSLNGCYAGPRSRAYFRKYFALDAGTGCAA